MQKLTLCILLILLTRSVSAQIILVETDLPVVLTGVDTIKMTKASSPFPMLLFTTGATWDMTGMVDSNSLMYLYRTTFSTFQFVDSESESVFSYSYKSQPYSSVESWGIVESGMNILDTSYELSSLTFGFEDSFFIPAQTIDYSSPDITIPFPATYGTWWNANYYYDIAYKLSLAFPPNDHTPGFVLWFVTKRNTVDGWGWVKINDINGSPSPDIPVLQVKCRTIVSDSFYLNGEPLPGTLLTLFSVQQGKADTIYEQHYLRRGYVTPVVNVRFRDESYTQPLWAKKHIHRLLPDEISNVNDASVSIYPNPVTGNKLFIHTQQPGASYSIQNVLGATVASGVIKEPVLTVPDDLVNGLYFLEIYSGDARSVSRIQIQR
jgi:hypothetical protein